MAWGQQQQHLQGGHDPLSNTVASGRGLIIEPASVCSSGLPPPPAYAPNEQRSEFAQQLSAAFDNTAFDGPTISALAHKPASATIAPPPPPSQPYAHLPQQHPSQNEEPDPSGSGSEQLYDQSHLGRSDTLAPSDSISMYEERQLASGAARQHQLDPTLRQSDATLAPELAASEYPYRKSGLYTDPYASQSNSNPYGVHDEDDVDDEYYPRKSAGPFSNAYDQNPYRGSHMPSSSSAHIPLTRNGASMGFAEDEEDEARQLKDAHRNSNRDSSHLFSNQHAERSPLGRIADKFGRRSADGESDLSKVEQQVERRRAGVFRQKYGILALVMAFVYIIIFIVELIRSKAMTGQAFQTKPQFQPMLGPPFEFFIAFPLGARFVPCMRNVPTRPATMLLPCLNATTSSSASLSTGNADLCPIWQVCGMDSASGPFQGYRFITAMFIHAGVIHLLFNIIAQLTLVVQVEKILGTPAFALIYLAGGIGGNLLGGNFGRMSPALGASGAVYTAVGVEITDLILNWHWEARRKTRLSVSAVFALLGLGLGLLPGIDNFSHIGGFLCGVLGGLAFGPSIHHSNKHRIGVWLVRLVSLAFLISFFVALATNFYKADDPAQACRWCQYLSCLPVFSQCRNDGLQTTTTTTSPS